MDTFTIRPVTDWSVSFSTYWKGTWKQLYSNTTSASQGLTAPAYSHTDATGEGFTSDATDGRFLASREETEYGELGFTNAGGSNASFAATGTQAFDPSTYSSHVLSDSGPPSSASYDTTLTRDWSSAFNGTTGFSTRLAQTNGDTYGSETRGTSHSWRDVSSGSGSSYDTTSPGPTVTDNATLAATTRTASGSSSQYTTEQQTAFYSIFTSTASDGFFNGISTSSYTIPTTHTGQLSSSWNTCGTYLSELAATRTDQDGDSSHAITYTADITARYTTLAGTSTVDQTTFVRTNYLFQDLEDTVCLLNAGRDSDFNLSGLLWTFALTGLDATASTTGRFSDLYQSASGNTVTVSDYKKFSTISVQMSGITLSVGSASSLDSTGGTVTYDRTSYNGSFYPDQSLTSTDSTGGTHAYTLPPVMTESTLRTFDLSGVSSMESTWTTHSTNPPASTTIFTHEAVTSTYRESDSSWITGTVSSSWVSASSNSFGKHVLYQPATTTSKVSYRGTTADELLISSFSVTGSVTSVSTDGTGGTQGLGTSAVYLGMVKRTSSRVITLERTDTVSIWDSRFHREISQYGSTSSSGTTLNNASATGTDPVPLFTDVNEQGETQSWGDELNVTAYSEHRLGAVVYHQPINDNHPALNEARFRALPVGWCGFGGSFTVTDLTVARTTSEGLLAGSTFSGQHVSLQGIAEAAAGVSFVPVGRLLTIAGGAARASIISVPSVMTSVISIAATWTSTTQTGSATSETAVTSRLATHTIGLADVITGDFWTSEALTVNSHYRADVGFGDFAGSGGYGIGQNILESSYQVIVDAGHVEWTEYSGSQSTAALTSSASSSDGRVSFTVPWSHAIVFSAEPILTIKWEPGASNHHFFFSTPYLRSP